MERSHLTYLYPDGCLQAVVPFWSVGRDEVVAGWTVDGSQIMYWATADGLDPRSLPLGDRFAADLTSAPRTWRGTMFRLFVPAQPLQVLHFFTESGDFRYWYVDFETPKLADGHGGWTTCDLELDLIIRPDFTTEWKDEDEFRVAREQGYLDPQAVDVVLSVADAVYRDPLTFIRSLPDWRDFPGSQGLEPMPLPDPATWQPLLRPSPTLRPAWAESEGRRLLG